MYVGWFPVMSAGMFTCNVLNVLVHSAVYHVQIAGPVVAAMTSRATNYNQSQSGRVCM